MEKTHVDPLDTALLLECCYICQAILVQTLPMREIVAQGICFVQNISMNSIEAHWSLPESNTGLQFNIESEFRCLQVGLLS